MAAPPASSGPLPRLPRLPCPNCFVSRQKLHPRCTGPPCFPPAAAAWHRRRPPRQRTTIPSGSSGACRQLRGRQRQPRRRTCGRLLTAISGTTQSGARWTSQTGTPRASCAAPSWPPASGEWREAAAVAAGGAGVFDNKGEQRGPLAACAAWLPAHLLCSHRSLRSLAPTLPCLCPPWLPPLAAAGRWLWSARSAARRCPC